MTKLRDKLRMNQTAFGLQTLQRTKKKLHLKDENFLPIYSPGEFHLLNGFFIYFPYIWTL